MIKTRQRCDKKMEETISNITSNCMKIDVGFNKIIGPYNVQGKSFDKLLCGSDVDDFLSELNIIIERHRNVPRIDPDVDRGEWSWEQYDSHKEDLDAIFNDIKDLYARFEDRRNLEIKIPYMSVSAESGLGGTFEPDYINISIEGETVNEHWFAERHPRNGYSSPEEYAKIIPKREHTSPAFRRGI